MIMTLKEMSCARNSQYGQMREKSHWRQRRGVCLFKPIKQVIAMIVSLCALDVLAAPFERTIEAPDGVGNVVALTNVLTEWSSLTSEQRKNVPLKIFLKPGVYDLSGIEMTPTHHLLIASCSETSLFAGLGESRDKTILVGGGESGGRGVIKAEGAGNWRYLTISNLTVTGGWTASNGGGICGPEGGTVVYRDLVVSNNYAAGSSNGTGGGGCFRGRAFDCLFANNKTARWGGGMMVTGKCGMLSDEGQGAWRCEFRDNHAVQHGGGLAVNGGGQCNDCDFYDNSADGVCSGVYVYSIDYNVGSSEQQILRKSSISDCEFYNGKGAPVYNHLSPSMLVAVSNCVIATNINNGDNGVLHGCDMKDCIVEDNSSSNYILYDCCMERCTVRRNNVSSNSNGIDFRSDSASVLTNVNCLIQSNGFVNGAYGAIVNGKVLVNCTIVGNNAVGSNWGRIIDKCALWNCVMWDNKIGSSFRDVRTKKIEGGRYTLSLTNCVFMASDIDAAEIAPDGTVLTEGFGNCRKVSKAALKLADEPNGDYVPTYRSVLYNAGCSEDWILALSGMKDLAEKARFFGDGIDIGAYECQDLPPGLVFSIR